MFGESFKERFTFLQFTEYLIKKCESEENFDEAERYKKILKLMTENLQQDPFYTSYINKLSNQIKSKSI